MNKSQVLMVKSADIEELMGLLAVKFTDPKTMGVKMLMLCFVVGELCVKIEADCWAFEQSYKKSIKQFRKMAEKISREIYDAGKNIPKFE